MLLGFMHLFFVAADLLCVVVLVRLLSYKWQAQWLTTFNSAEKPLVDWFVLQIQKAMVRVTAKQYSEKQLLVIGILTLALIRLFLMGLGCS